MSKIAKANAGYVHFEGVDYKCGECYKFNGPGKACFEVLGTILPWGSCNTFIPGDGPPTDADVRQKLTQLMAGYAENKPGFSCKRCEYFDPENWDCRKVDKDSPGPDKGIIHPNACCNNWDKDVLRGVF